MNKPMTVDSELARIFGSDARSFMAEHADVMAKAKLVNPLRDATPASWATPTHEGAEL